jgi:KaiC/GvpD/RAD55 family RecA-like ATPase
VRQVELAPGRFVLPSGHARTQPARAFPAQTVKTGWTLLSTGSVVVLVLQALIQRFLPGFFMNRAVRKAGQRLKRKEPAPARPLEEEYIKDFINSPQGEALSTPSFLVVSGSQGIGKSTMLNNLLSEHVKNGKRVLPLKMSSRPGEDLKLNEALPKALQAVNLPRYYPEQVEYMLEKVNETCKRRTGSAVVVYLQLTTKSRGDKFSRDACDDIASTLGACARNITYDNAACKFILEVSVSAVADIITERFNMSRLVVVRPLPFEDFTSVVKEVAKQGNDFRTLNKVLAEDDMDEVLKHYYIRVGGNLRALDLILENVSREGQKGADAVIKRVEQWYKRRVEPIQRKLDDQEVKDYLLKVAGAGPMGYLPESDEDTKMALKLLREEPADCVLRSTTSETVALKHWHFVAKLFQEDEQKLRDAGYM